jgi:hypothetical protein
MQINSLFRKGLVLAVVVLFVGIGVVPIADCNFVQKRPSDHYCHPKFSGKIGDNGWFVSPVNVSFVYNPEIVRTIFYNINGGQWLKYTKPFVISSDSCSHLVKWYFIDFSGEKHQEDQSSIKIDHTAPMCVLNRQRGCNKIVYTAVPYDNMSGIGRVEFYLNGVLQCTAMAPGPYTWTLYHIRHINGHVRAIGYDMAGNPGWAEQTTSYDTYQSSTQSDNQYNCQLLRNLLYSLMLRRQMIS